MIDYVETVTETINGSLTTRTSTWDPDEYQYVVNGTTIRTLGGLPRTSSSIQKRDIDGNSLPFSVVDENGFTLYVPFASLYSGRILTLWAVYRQVCILRSPLWQL